MPRHLPVLGPELREVIGAWVVCFFVAAGCFTVLAAAPGRRGDPEALIGSVAAATVAAASADRADAYRLGRC